jgi:hypothetical protein
MSFVHENWAEGVTKIQVLLRNEPIDIDMDCHALARTASFIVWQVSV